MIARVFILIVLIIVLPDLYIDRYYFANRKSVRTWRRLLRWLPATALILATAYFAVQSNFIPENSGWLYLYLLLIGVLVLPKIFFVLCSLLGRLWCKLRRRRQNWGNLIGFFLAIIVACLVLHGSFVESRHLEVKHIELAFPNLPEAFDGYRMVHFSDAHVGTYAHFQQDFLKAAIDSINAQQADVILFTGDLVNQQPQELYPVQELLSSLHAKDGVFSILGNHDYSTYIDADPVIKVANEHEMISRQRQFGWKLLLNSRQEVHRGNDCIIMAGEECNGRHDDEQRTNLSRTLDGIDSTSFVILLQHHPSDWRRRILPDGRASLTLSGHTHGGQVQLFGARLSGLVYSEDFGLYEQDGRVLYVSGGIGGVLPFRIGVTPEITVITLRKKKTE